MHRLLVEFEGVVEGVAGLEDFRKQEVQHAEGLGQVVLHWRAGQDHLEARSQLQLQNAKKGSIKNIKHY